MTEWIVEGQRARARCRGYDIEAQWGSGRDFMNTTSERPSATPGAKRPDDHDQGIIIRVRSDHQGVDKLTMLVITDHEPEDAVRQYTREHTPESLLPKHKDWIDEWKWLASYRNRARWRRMGNQATAFIGHLTLTVKMTTMEDATQRINSAADPNQPYAMSMDHDEGKEGFEKDTQVFIVELREDLHLITAMITRTSDEKTNSIKEYIKGRDPAVIATACLVRSYDNTPEAGPLDMSPHKER